ncbi:glycosyl hydrolase [Catellatospora bangladeshensis]|uniref:glycosyl hydrolase n=1 Tax=Catellatospora bangladeshensis TaxID=310355 RepID=UPI00361A90E2
MSEQQAVQNLEASLGQSLRGSRIFVLWDQQFPDSYHNWLRSTNHTLLLSVKARRLNGQRIPWSSIANAAPGQAIYDDIVSWSTRIKNWGAPIYFIFNHEPEASTNLQNGDATDFKNAWRRIVTVFREQGVTNAKYLLTMTDYSFFVNPTDRRRAEKWYPGDDVVDGIGADSYNWYTCRGSNEGWKSLQSIIDPLRQFGTQHPDEELWLPEFATIEDPAQPSRKAAWLAAAQSLFKQPGWEQFRGRSTSTPSTTTASTRRATGGPTPRRSPATPSRPWGRTRTSVARAHPHPRLRRPAADCSSWSGIRPHSPRVTPPSATG